MAHHEKSDALERVLAGRATAKALEAARLAPKKKADWVGWIQRGIGLVLSLWAVAGIAIWVSEAEDRRNDRSARIVDLVSRANNVIQQLRTDGNFSLNEVQAAWALETMARFRQRIDLNVEGGSINLNGFRLDCGAIYLRAETVSLAGAVIRGSRVFVQSKNLSLDSAGLIGSRVHFVAKNDSPSLNLDGARLDRVTIEVDFAEENQEVDPPDVETSGSRLRARDLTIEGALGDLEYDWVELAKEEEFSLKGCRETPSAYTGEHCAPVGAKPKPGALFMWDADQQSKEKESPNSEPLRNARCPDVR